MNSSQAFMFMTRRAAFCSNGAKISVHDEALHAQICAEAQAQLFLLS